LPTILGVKVEVRVNIVVSVTPGDKFHVPAVTPLGAPLLPRIAVA
jgi:hypothetical protein